MIFMSDTVIKKYFKIVVLIIFLTVLVKSCIVPYNSSISPSQTASEFAKNDHFEESVAEIIRFDYDDFRRSIVFRFLAINKDTIEEFKFIRSNGDLSIAFLPEGGKYKIIYNPKRPKSHRSLRIFMNEPVYDSAQVFERTEARITREFFIDFRTPIIHYGGLQLIFKYNVNGKECESHNGITLHEVFPNVKNPKEELSFEGKKFVVEYDVDNPYIARILLDEEVK